MTSSFAALGNPTSTADNYLEISFSSTAGSLGAYGNTGEIWARVNKADWSNFNETNDYSYDGSKNTYTDWLNVTLYRNGVLVWGTPPDSPVPTSSPIPPTMTGRPTA